MNGTKWILHYIQPTIQGRAHNSVKSSFRMTMMKTMTRTKMTFKLNSITILFLLLQIDLNAFKVSSEDVVTRLSTSVNSPSNNTSNSNNIYNSNNIKVKLSETVESDSSSSNSNDGSSTATTVSNLYVATTTKYVGKSTKALSR